MAERPGRWDLLDRPSDPVVADSGEIEVQLNHFRSLAEILRVEGQRLARIGSGESLKGAYADELRSASSEVSKDLTMAVGRYDSVVRALVDFKPAVDVALAGSAAALDDAIDANGSRGMADAMPLSVAGSGTELTTEQQHANDDKASASTSASARLEAAKAKLSGVLGQFDDEGRRAAGIVRAGFNDGLKDSGWDRFKYAFAKFLKIFVEILAIIGMVLAVIAMVIPGIGPLLAAALMTIATALEAIVFAAEVALVAMGEGSWLDIGLSIASFVTFGGAKAIGTVVKRAHKNPAGASPPNRGEYIELEDLAPNVPSRPNTPGSPGAADSPAPASPAGSTSTAPSPAAAKTDLEVARDWNVPNGSTKTPHPVDLGENAKFIKPGTESWLSPTGVTYTRLTNWVGYKGITNEGGEGMLRDGAKYLEVHEPNGNGNPVKDWKAFYATDDVEAAGQYAGEMNDMGRHPGGMVLRYENSREVTLVQPSNEVSLEIPDPDNPAMKILRPQTEVAQDARALFPEHSPDSALTEGLGGHDMILRYPLWDTAPNAQNVNSDMRDTFEFLVPWSVSEGGDLTVAGRMIPGRKFEDPTWEPSS